MVKFQNDDLYIDLLLSQTITKKIFKIDIQIRISKTPSNKTLSDRSIIPKL